MPVLAFLLASGLALVQAGQADERTRMQVPPLAIFESMLRFAEGGEADKIARSLELLAPVLAQHAARFGAEQQQALLSSLAQPDAGGLAQAVRQLVARDILVLLAALQAAPAPRARTIVRTAALEWSLIEPAALKEDARVAQGISALLRDVREAVEAAALREAAPELRRLERGLTSMFSAPR
ncbi:MAG: hypothetical protein AB7O37_10450 [Vicinamibacteria bacterium]